jgi:hypothetical protein
MNDNRHIMPRKETTAMRPYVSAASDQPAGRGSLSNPFQRRLTICVVQTVVNAIIVVRFAGTLYLVTAHHALQQIGVTLMFAALLGSLARMWFLTVNSRSR